MGIMHSRRFVPVMRKTKQLLAYIVQNNPNISITGLMKLSYIADLISVKKFGKQISNFDYKRYKYGPFDNKIYGYLKDLISEEVISEDGAISQTGDEYIVYVFNKDKEEDFSFDRLSSDEQQIINEVLESLKGYGAKALVELAYKTKPMKKIGAKIGNRKGLNEKLDLYAS
jgi:uncharacterized phage-associated protein